MFSAKARERKVLNSCSSMKSIVTRPHPLRGGMGKLEPQTILRTDGGSASGTVVKHGRRPVRLRLLHRERHRRERRPVRLRLRHRERHRRERRPVPLQLRYRERHRRERHRGVGAAQAIGGRADDQLGTHQSAQRGMWWRGRKSRLWAVRAEDATRRFMHSQMLKGQSNDRISKIGFADGIQTRICEDVATRHIVSFISMDLVNAQFLHLAGSTGVSCLQLS